MNDTKRKKKEGGRWGEEVGKGERRRKDSNKKGVRTEQEWEVEYQKAEELLPHNGLDGVYQ